ncbi:hypothetical protein CRYUN_Cryun24cG0050100 [Craigia yunnanensis]
MPASDLRAALAGPPDILIFVFRQIFYSNLALEMILKLLHLSFLDVVNAFLCLLPQGVLFVPDVDQLKKLILHNPFILTLSEVEDVKDEVISKNIQQFWISCSMSDKLLYVLALLKLELVLKKVLIFTNTIDAGFRLKLFFEKFGIKSAILNAELPQNSRLHILEVSLDEMEIFEEIKSLLGDEEDNDTNIIAPFSLLINDAVESLRYRAEDVARSVTRIAVRESRAQDLRNEILNSEKLKFHFDVNPRDLDLLKHDKVLSKDRHAPHLCDVPDYLLDQKTRDASKMVKLARAATGDNKSARCQGAKKKFRKSRDPLKTFSAEAPKRGRKDGMKGEGKGTDFTHKRKKTKICLSCKSSVYSCRRRKFCCLFNRKNVQCFVT